MYVCTYVCMQGRVHVYISYSQMQNYFQEIDYRKKVEKFKAVFEPLDSGDNSAIESRWPYIKCDHSIQHFVVHNIKGYLQQKVLTHALSVLESVCTVCLYVCMCGLWL